ncbi:hypothetical protein L3Q82_001995 [Scortum barcoo]|uniref:Uncharacterized protein n=1 Tax=Scortum barcoo TaxID=214431 RepID=A0ACB8W0W5_9TELE|nr:hypothetical protein L3Q82_001995 [Scortum barcoo]
MIDFVVVSSDLWPYVLDTRVKRGAELSTDHHLVVKLDPLAEEEVGQTWQTQVWFCWERLAEPSVREVFNSHLQKSFSQIPREAGDIESEWTMFSASIVDVQAVLAVGLLMQLTGTGRPSKPQPGWSWRQKHGSGRSLVRPQKGEAVLCQHCLQCGWGAVDLN